MPSSLGRAIGLHARKEFQLPDVVATQEIEGVQEESRGYSCQRAHCHRSLDVGTGQTV